MGHKARLDISQVMSDILHQPPHNLLKRFIKNMNRDETYEVIKPLIVCTNVPLS
jgi:hypothetical protein